MIGCANKFILQYYVESALYYIEKIAEENHVIINFNWTSSNDLNALIAG
jgi:hypothetical protein